MTRDIGQYEAAYAADYGFEACMVTYRRRFVIERLRQRKPRTVLEIGCGSELLYGEFLAGGGEVDRWTIVEPGKRFAEAALARAQDLPNLKVVEAFFEDAAEKLIRSGESFAFVVCASLLHEVPDAGELLDSIAAVMSGETVVHVNVPNASSLHRRLARSMGLVQDLKEKSSRNVQLQQQRVFDRESLRGQVMRAGLEVLDEGGYLIKPFTHAQMELIRGQLGTAVLDGLYELGKEAPEWASEIFVEARKAAA